MRSAFGAVRFLRQETSYAGQKTGYSEATSNIAIDQAFCRLGASHKAGKCNKGKDEGLHFSKIVKSVGTTDRFCVNTQKIEVLLTFLVMVS